jgi:hypothetical protein
VSTLKKWSGISQTFQVIRAVKQRKREIFELDAQGNPVLTEKKRRQKDTTFDQQDEQVTPPNKERSNPKRRSSLWWKPASRAFTG